MSVPGGGGPRGELSSAHGWPRQSAEGDQLPIGSYRVRTGATVVGGRRPAAHRELSSAHGWPRDRGACSPLPGRARTQPLSPCASIPFDTRANTLCGVWAFSSARGPAIPSLGKPARVRNRGFTCGTGGPRTDPGGVVFYNLVAGTRRWIQKCGADAFIGPAFPREEDRKIRRGRPWRGRRGSR